MKKKVYFPKINEGNRITIPVSVTKKLGWDKTKFLVLLVNEENGSIVVCKPNIFDHIEHDLQVVDGAVTKDLATMKKVIQMVLSK